MRKKLPVPDYIKEIREKELTYDEAIERILEKNRVISAPIPVVAIAKSFGFVVRTASFSKKNIISVMADSAKPESFFMECREIIISADIPAASQAMAAAHEIAHFVMHCREDEDFFEVNRFGFSGSDIEKAANDFALRLLVPTWMLRGFLMGVPRGISRGDVIYTICMAFCVSEDMAEQRLREVGYALR